MFNNKQVFSQKGEDTEAAKIREERLAAYAAKKSKKPALIAKVEHNIRRETVGRRNRYESYGN